MSLFNDSLTTPASIISATPWWQRRTITIGIALLGLVLVIIIMTLNVTKYEAHLANGNTVLLALAPVDPRGFMQGDYMTLSYALERDVFEALQPDTATADGIDADFNNDLTIYEPMEGYVVVKLDDNNVGQFVRLANSNRADTLAENEMAIYYRLRHGSLKLATNAFFFQDGHAEAFEAAEYGLFRVNDKGEPLLTDMVNGEFEVIVGANSEGKKESERLENLGR